MNKWYKKGLLTACVVAGASFTSAAFATTWNMPTRSNMQNYFTKNIIEFANEVKTKTDGKIDIVVQPEDALVKQPEVLRAIQTQQVPIGEWFMSLHSNENAIFGIDSIPFLATDFKQNARLLKLSRGYISEVLAKRGVKLLFVVPWPYNSFYSQKKLTSVADFKGTKFRAYNPITARLAELMGATPVTVQQSEVSQAFSTGVIDAMITSPATGVDTQAWDFVKYFTDVRAMAPWNLVAVNQKVFDGLDKKNQNVLLEASAEAEKRGWKLAPEVTGQLIKELANHGMKIEEPTDEMEKELTAIHETLIKEWNEKAGPEGKKIIDEYRKSE